jgi:hypothetical protein
METRPIVNTCHSLGLRRILWRITCLRVDRDRKAGRAVNQTAIVSFPGVSDAQGNILAASLQPRLREAHPSISVERRRINPEAQDGGATLAIILGSAAITAIAKGIAEWLARNSGTAIEVHAPDGTSVIVKYGTGADCAQIVEAALRGNQ